jgi:hypothetical protein
MTTGVDDLKNSIERAGFAYRGAFHPQTEDGVPPLANGQPCQTLVLVGMVGSDQWSSFRRSPEAEDSLPDPLDRWGHRQLTRLAKAFDADALEPSNGPPWWPFQRWAQRAEAVYPSPVGLLIHPVYGLWHSYRGALALATRLALAPRHDDPSPCVSCIGQPCLRTCPVQAYTAEGFAADICLGALNSAVGLACLGQGCAARRACPVGRSHAQAPEQASFHVRAFLHNQGP